MKNDVCPMSLDPMTQSQIEDHADLVVKPKRKPSKAAQERAAKRAILKEYFGDDPDFCKVIMEDYKL